MQTDGIFLRRLGWITAAAVLVAVAWQIAPIARVLILDRHAAPRVVEARGDLADDEQATIALFETARESVVFITTAERIVDPWTRNAHDVPRGNGSGFVWDLQGRIVTNNHVVEGASSAIVRLADGRSYRARLLGADPRHDLAVLGIDLGAAPPPPPLPLGESASLQVGQKVFAIGNPFGLDWTLTTGIVSALDRELPSGRGFTIRGLVQTDAAINPGNSGGPLLDSAGRLIGVNTAIFSPSGASAGIGFAVPVGVVTRVVPQLIAEGRYTPPRLGVRLDARIDAMALRQGLEGALVLGVEPGSPAEAAGIRPARMTDDGRLIPGDVIVAIEGEPVGSSDDLLAALERRRVGETVRLELLRGGDLMTVEATLADAG
jgi:S1-C subfamily serine protease